MNTKDIPLEPGCYFFKNSTGIIVYIGNAKCLKKRVSSYFTKNHQDPKTQALVKEIRNVEVIVTKTEVEALLLEANLIKKHTPKYNIDLKDSKRYAYILATQEDFPRLLVARNQLDKGKYFGPFVSAAERDDLLKIVRMVFKIRTCKKLPKKACLRYHIGLCSAPCINKIPKEQYCSDVSNSEKVLSGKTDEDRKSVV